MLSSKQIFGNSGASIRPSPGNVFPSVAANSSKSNDPRLLYAINHQVISIGKLISSAKRQIRFRFGFASFDKGIGKPSRSKIEEHEVVLVWSPMISGRAVIHCDGQEVHNSVIRGVMMDVTWSIRGNHLLRIVAHDSGGNKTSSNFHQYELFVNGVSYFNFLTLDQLLGGVVNQNEKLHAPPTSMRRSMPVERGGSQQPRVSVGKVGRIQQRYPDYYEASLDQSDKSSGSLERQRMMSKSLSSSGSMFGPQLTLSKSFSKVDLSDRSKGSFDQSDRSRRSAVGQSMNESLLDLSDRSKSSFRLYQSINHNDRSADRNFEKRKILQCNTNDSDRSSNDAHHYMSRRLPASNPSSRARRRNTEVSVSSMQTEKVSNVTKLTSTPKVLHSYKIEEKAPSVICENDDDEDNDDIHSVDAQGRTSRESTLREIRTLSPPTGNVTIVYTDVQGSTSLWETYPTAMKRAQDIHDRIMRQCYADHKGYEITTVGDSFNLAFRHPVDALAFALQAQIKLYKADWPPEILNHPDGKVEPYLKFKGLRVRFGINHGPTTNQIHRITGRTIYSGEGVKIAKAVESLCCGGQILTTIETWKAVGGLAERYLGRPQILDCGEHVLFEAHRTRYSRRIMQLVPRELAFDFFEARGQAEDGTVKDAALVKGRLFPPILSKKQLSTSFLNAPYTNGLAVICFVNTVGLDDEDSENHGTNLLKLSKNVRKQLLRSDPPGYECQEDGGFWMLAFERVEQAVMFGLKLMASVREGGAKEQLLGDVDCDKMYKIGIVSGPFTAMGPHKTTGMADYFGPIVNRAARVASECEPGEVCVGVALADGARIDPPNFGSTIQVRLLGIKQLKGVTVDVAVYCCSERASGSLKQLRTL